MKKVIKITFEQIRLNAEKISQKQQNQLKGGSDGGAEGESGIVTEDLIDV